MVSRAILVGSWVALGLASLGGCGSQPLDADESAIPTIQTLADLPAALAAGICQAYERCCVSQGFDFDPVAAAGCVQDNIDAICPQQPSDAQGQYRHCARVFRGHLEPGEACQDVVECRTEPARASSCDPDLGCLLGPSYTKVMLGEPCQATCVGRPGELDFDCVSFLPETLPDGGVLAACHEQDGLFCSAISETCETSAVGELCGIRSICAVGAYCEVDTSICRARRSSGPCAAQPEVCDDASYCSFEHDQCVPRRLENGQGCQSDRACESYYCNPDGVCQTALEAGTCATVLD